MNRSHGLTLVGALLVGFLAGYFAQEYMAARQPPRLLPGQPQARLPGAAPNPGPAAPGQPPLSMEQIQALSARVAQNPDDVEALLALANVNFDMGRSTGDPMFWNRAIELYSRFIELRPDSPDIISDLGICYRSQGEFEKALEQFERAKQIAPDHWPSRFNEVVVQAFDLKNYTVAEELLDELRRLQPGNPDIERLAAEVERSRAATQG